MVRYYDDFMKEELSAISNTNIKIILEKTFEQFPNVRVFFGAAPYKESLVCGDFKSVVGGHMTVFSGEGFYRFSTVRPQIFGGTYGARGGTLNIDFQMYKSDGGISAKVSINGEKNVYKDVVVLNSVELAYLDKRLQEEILDYKDDYDRYQKSGGKEKGYYTFS